MVPTSTATHFHWNKIAAILLIYWTQDCINVCLGLVWNRYEIINININLLISAGNSSLLTSTASNRIHFLGHKINFRNSLCSIKLCLWWPRTEKPWLKCVIVFQGLTGSCHPIFMKSTCYLFKERFRSNQNQNCQSGKKEKFHGVFPDNWITLICGRV